MSESHWCQCENCTAERIRLDQQLAEAGAENERLKKRVNYLKEKHTNAMKWGALEEAKYDEVKVQLRKVEQQLAEVRAENERLDKKLRKCAGQCKHLSEEYADCADKYNKLRKEHEALQQAAVVYIDAKNNAPAGYDDDAEATAFDNLAALAKGGEGRC